MALIIIIFSIIRMYLLTNVVTMQQALSLIKSTCMLEYNYTYENGVKFEIKSL